MIEFHLEPELAARLEAVAHQTGRDPEAYLADAIRESIEDLEDTAAAEAVLAHPGKRWTLEQIEAKEDLRADGLAG